MKAVSNATPLIWLARIECFDIPPLLFEVVRIPSAVFREVVVDGEGLAGCAETGAGLRDGWLVQTRVEDTEKVRLLVLTVDQGEAEAIILAQEQRPDILLVDDRKARVMADTLGLRYMGTVGLMLLAHQKGHPGIREAFSALRRSQFRMSDELYRQIEAELDTAKTS